MVGIKKEMAMTKSYWFPIKSRGVYEPIEYSDDIYLNPKKWVCSSENTCQAICDNLNNKIDEAIETTAQKCFNNIINIEKRHNIDRRFIIPRFMSELKRIELEEDGSER